MQKFPLRNRCNPPSNNSLGTGSNAARGRDQGLHVGIQRTCMSMPPATARQATPTKKTVTTRICSQVYMKDSDNLATWDEVLSEGGKSKSLSPATSSLVDTNAVKAPAAGTTTQEPVQQTSAEGILGAASNATASSKSNKNNAKGNKSKDDDDKNRRQQPHQQRITAAPPVPTPTPVPTPASVSAAGTGAGAGAGAAAGAVMPAATAREFMTFERLRLGDQINFLLFDPYRTLKFLITELKSRLRTVVPDDVNVHKILVEIQQTMKRIRIPNATETSVPPRTAKTTTPRERRGATSGAGSARGGPAAGASALECIFPEERCHVIKNDPLINHARKVNSSCQTIASQLENVNACQMCEHRLKQGAAGCNQIRVNGNSSNAEDIPTDEMDGTEPSQRSKDHKRQTGVRRHISCKTLQDVIEMLRNKNKPITDEVQKIITQLEAELLNFQRELQRTFPSSSSTSCHQPSKEITNEQCKRLVDEDGYADEEGEEEQDEENDEERSGRDDDEEAGTSLDFSARSKRTRNHSADGKKAKSANQSQMKVDNPSQVMCHLEKEKLLLLQQFRATEMESIQGDLSELHAFIKDQLDGIYHSITRETLNVKYQSTDPKRSFRTRKTRLRTTHQKIPTAELLPSTSSLTAVTSSLSSNDMRREVRETSPESPLPVFKKTKSLPSQHLTCCGAGDGNANNTKSTTLQRHQLSSISSVSEHEHNDIGGADKVNKTPGERSPKKPNSHRINHGRLDQFFDQHHHSGRAKCCALPPEDTPSCRAKRIHFSAVECASCCCPHNGIADRVRRMIAADAARVQPDIKSTNKTSSAAMTCHQHCQHCHPQPPPPTTSTTAQPEQAQLISSSLPGPGPGPGTGTGPTATLSEVDETALNLDAVTNAAVRNIIEKAFATAAEHSNGIRMHRHRQCAALPSCPAHNSWQCVNPKNPAACQLKKQICGDEYECRINNTNSSANDNHSKYPEIHDCQKCRANNINPFGGLCLAKVHEVGADNVPTATATATAAFEDDGGEKNDADADAGGDGPVYWNEGSRAGDCTCHGGQRRQRATTKSPGRAALTPTIKATLQTDLEEFKEFLDEMIHSTPRLK